jgi:hypothetical protein
MIGALFVEMFRDDGRDVMEMKDQGKESTKRKVRQPKLTPLMNCRAHFLVLPLLY